MGEGNEGPGGGFALADDHFDPLGARPFGPGLQAARARLNERSLGPGAFPGGAFQPPLPVEAGEGGERDHGAGESGDQARAHDRSPSS